MGSGMYEMYPHNYGVPSQFTRPQVSYGQIGAGGCTCGPYASVIPPEPCPVHDPERAYWRMRILREFGRDQYSTTTTTTTGSSIYTSPTGRKPGEPEPQFDIPKYESPKVEKPDVHFNASNAGPERLACGVDPFASDTRWARVAAWVTCADCRLMINS